jgi:adenine-specific DNA-methyltransferase
MACETAFRRTPVKCPGGANIKPPLEVGVSDFERILQIATNPGDIVLDSFAGSGTTAHAVLNLNKANGGNRRFILVEAEKGFD